MTVSRHDRAVGVVARSNLGLGRPLLTILVMVMVTIEGEYQAQSCCCDSRAQPP